MKKAFIENGELFFNSNSRGLISLGGAYFAAIDGIEDLPSGWSTDEILREAGVTDDFFESANAVNSAWHSVSNNWLFDMLLAAWEKGASIRMTQNQIDEQATRNTGPGVDDKSFLRQSGGVDVSNWTGVKTTAWTVNGSPIVTIIQRRDVSRNRFQFPILSRKPCNVNPSIQIEIQAPGVYEI